MARLRNPGKRIAEKRFPNHVNFPVPSGGLGSRLNEMVEWCRANIPAGGWEVHGHSEKEAGRIAVDYARFYFLTEADADLFRWRWMPESLARQRG
jgi:hypothetical protein